MNALKTKHPQTSFWMDSMTDEDIAYALVFVNSKMGHDGIENWATANVKKTGVS